MPAFKSGASQMNASSLDAFPITPSDTVDLEQPTRGIYCGTGGNLNYITFGGRTVLRKNLLAGVIHPISATRVLATGTTCTDILGEV
jgi:hypothetical protein